MFYKSQNQRNRQLIHDCLWLLVKMDEDIFIGREFFSQMIKEFHHIEKIGEYRIGFAVPVIPLNCCGCVTYLNVIGKKQEYEERIKKLEKEISESRKLNEELTKRLLKD